MTWSSSHSYGLFSTTKSKLKKYLLQKETASKSGRLKLRIHELVENEDDFSYFMRRTWTHKNPYRAIAKGLKNGNKPHIKTLYRFMRSAFSKSSTDEREIPEIIHWLIEPVSEEKVLQKLKYHYNKTKTRYSLQGAKTQLSLNCIESQ